MNVPKLHSLFIHAIMAVIGLSVATQSIAAVSIVKGKTIIPHGNAISDKDLTIKNDKLAFSLALGSAPPWGVARGCIVDVANVKTDGSLSPDRVAFADFIPNNWSSWPNTYQTVDVIKDSADEAIVNITRDFGQVVISTTYRLAEGSDLIHVQTTMTNQGEAILDMHSGFTLWPDAGYKFAVPAQANKANKPNNEATNEQSANFITDRFVGYGADWAVALHAPDMTEVKNQSRDLYTHHNLQAGQTVSFSGDYQVLASGDLAPVVRAEIERKNVKAGTLSGDVQTQSGKVLAQPAIVVTKDGVPYMWGLGQNGQYQFDLPVGEYQVYATGKGYSDSKVHTIEITENNTQTLSFNDLLAPGKVSIHVTDANTKAPLDAKIKIEKGNQPLIEFLGARTFFTELDRTGQATFPLAPGEYQLNISAGSGFNAQPELINTTVRANKSTDIASAITISTYPTQHGWYAGDLHHHANVLEGSTPPEYLVRSQLAAGLNVLFVSDHDSTKNNAETQALADKRGVPFIPSIEVSPSWGHFNAFPIDAGAQLSVDPGVDDIHSIIKDVRRMGATVIASNHPYIPYGYLSSLDKNTAPGGFNPSIDLFELNAGVDNKPTIEKAHQLWSQGLPYYYTAGSDTHDVWNQTSGLNRMFVFTGSKPDGHVFAQAMKNGRAYVSFGPVIYPQNVMFGDTIKFAKNQPQSISFDLVAVNGLKSVQLIGNAEANNNTDSSNNNKDQQEGSSRIINQQTLQGQSASITFDVPQSSGWVALVVEDSKGHKAYSNPIWLKEVDKSQF
ncbi:CehA/McbA family metallohydrolase [Paraglaciecola polaris]|uniref:Phosphoesterase PHP, N-terminal n=1 Tax=Paraglaciecola polaris LMG 21857 TaxID=1129793 RepID=K7AHF1_9ALTE|nr:CehA/McbA family metallohydrolase [Paraglaciecola polaris]GAC34675.1 phosphoesterase PHP, N-terminal [Paraglaciecola polaris LMG 21857]